MYLMRFALIKSTKLKTFYNNKNVRKDVLINIPVSTEYACYESLSKKVKIQKKTTKKTIFLKMTAS